MSEPIDNMGEFVPHFDDPAALAVAGSDAYYALPPRLLTLFARNERSLWEDRAKPVADAHEFVNVCRRHVLPSRDWTTTLAFAMAHARLDMIDRNRTLEA